MLPGLRMKIKTSNIHELMRRGDLHVNTDSKYVVSTTVSHLTVFLMSLPADATLQSLRFNFRRPTWNTTFGVAHFWVSSFDSADRIRGDNYSINSGRECVTFWGWAANVLHLRVYMNNSYSLITPIELLIKPLIKKAHDYVFNLG